MRGPTLGEVRKADVVASPEILRAEHSVNSLERTEEHFPVFFDTSFASGKGWETASKYVTASVSSFFVCFVVIFVGWPNDVLCEFETSAVSGSILCPFRIVRVPKCASGNCETYGVRRTKLSLN